MSTLTIKGPVTVAAAPRPQRVLPADVGAMASCKGLWIAHPDWVTTSSGFITQITSRDTALNNMTQGTGGMRPQQVADTQLGRTSARFLDDYTSFMTAGSTFNYSLAWTMAVVFKSALPNAKTFQPLLGGYGASGPERAFMSLRSTGVTETDGNAGILYGSSGSAYPVVKYVANEWQMMMAGYDGTSLLTFQMGNSVPQAITCSAETASTTVMRMGHTVPSGAAYAGFIDLGAAFNVNLFDSGQATNLASVRAMLRTVYRSVVPL